MNHLTFLYFFLAWRRNPTCQRLCHTILRFWFSSQSHLLHCGRGNPTTEPSARQVRRRVWTWPFWIWNIEICRNRPRSDEKISTDLNTHVSFFLCRLCMYKHIYIYMYIPGTHQSFVLPPKLGSFPNKTRDIWVPGIYMHLWDDRSREICSGWAVHHDGFSNCGYCGFWDFWHVRTLTRTTPFSQENCLNFAKFGKFIHDVIIMDIKPLLILVVRHYP